ncbi:hypothetical protein BV20DRAFT_388922 [Pilatotrama ljubarskyi]|nr:hypothetical protein BV20DRAFT_388922 [Pilatotrama ljubarskyi]
MPSCLAGSHGVPNPDRPKPALNPFSGVLSTGSLQSEIFAVVSSFVHSSFVRFNGSPRLTYASFTVAVSLPFAVGPSHKASTILHTPLPRVVSFRSPPRVVSCCLSQPSPARLLSVWLCLPDFEVDRTALQASAVPFPRSRSLYCLVVFGFLNICVYCPSLIRSRFWSPAALSVL